MTTESKQDTPQAPRAGVSPLLGGAAAGAASVVVLTALATFLDGSPGAVGVLVGGGLTLAVFIFGLTAVNAVAKVLPAASLMVALLTYTLQLVVLLVVAAAVERAGLAGDELSRGWFAAGVISVTLLWLAGQVVGATRQRIPAYADAAPAHHPGGER